ncbi:MAG: hypothetical protein LUD68_00845 [Rikenellaceae bacterium]|nr:hypothetical protein [Rikenellaceae bacterium]
MNIKKTRVLTAKGAVRTGLLWGLFSLLCTETTAQQIIHPEPANPTLDYFKQGISPQVALMNRYGEYPVDYSTGLVDITIPLYTMQTASLSIPLEIKFHPSGLRADEREGLFGIRWALSGLGHISRTIKGYPDDYSYPFNTDISSTSYRPTFNDLFGTTSQQYLDGGVNGTSNMVFTQSTYTDDNGKVLPGGKYRDAEYDVFSYSLPTGRSGKFIAPGGTGIPMPYEPLKIFSGTDTRTGIPSITDENGVLYRFGETRTPEGSVNAIRYTDSDSEGWRTTWYLSSIISANKQDTILIDYKWPGNYHASPYRETLVYNHYFTTGHRFEEYQEDYGSGWVWVKSPLFLMLEE